MVLIVAWVVSQQEDCQYAELERYTFSFK